MSKKTFGVNTYVKQTPRKRKGRHSKRPNKKVWSQRNIEPIKWIKEGNHKREATKKEQSDYLKRAYAKQEKRFIDFERKYKSKIHALDNQIEKLEAELKEMK